MPLRHMVPLSHVQGCAHGSTKSARCGSGTLPGVTMLRRRRGPAQGRCSWRARFQSRSLRLAVRLTLPNSPHKVIVEGPVSYCFGLFFPPWDGWSLCRGLSLRGMAVPTPEETGPLGNTYLLNQVTPLVSSRIIPFLLSNNYDVLPHWGNPPTLSISTPHPAGSLQDGWDITAVIRKSTQVVVLVTEPRLGHQDGGRGPRGNSVPYHNHQEALGFTPPLLPSLICN